MTSIAFRPNSTVSAIINAIFNIFVTFCIFDDFSFSFRNLYLVFKVCFALYQSSFWLIIKNHRLLSFPNSLEFNWINRDLKSCNFGILMNQRFAIYLLASATSGGIRASIQRSCRQGETSVCRRCMRGTWNKGFMSWLMNEWTEWLNNWQIGWPQFWVIRIIAGHLRLQR